MVGEVHRTSVSGIQQSQTLSGTGKVGTLGEHQVEVGKTERGPTQKTGFGEKAAAFFSSLGDKFRSFGQALASIPGRIQESYDNWQTSRAQNKVTAWVDANVDLSSANKTRHSDNKTGDLAISCMMRAKEEFGAPGIHAMAGKMIADFQAIADKETKVNAQKVPPGPPVTWQEAARDGLKIELLKSPTFKDAERTLATLEKHFKTYEKAGGQGDLAEMGRIISSLKGEVTDLGSIDAMARSAFSTEVDRQLQDVESFFRGNSDASVGAATIMRNANPKQSAHLTESFRDMLTSKENRAAVDELAKLQPHEKPTREQTELINQLTTDFLDRAFGLSKDGGESFIAKFDDTARSFLRDTGNEIAGKGDVDSGSRNSAIRKWFSNGIALRDLAPIGMRVAEDQGVKHVGNLVSTNILRVVADVQANGTTAQKMSPGGLESYRDYIAQKGPEFSLFLQRLGMPVVE